MGKTGVVLPSPSSDFSFDENIRTLTDIFFGKFGGFSQHDNIVPFGEFHPGSVSFIRGQRKFGD